MVLKTLYDYYYRCKHYDPKSVPDFGKAVVPISFIIVINKDGTFVGIEDTGGTVGNGVNYTLPFNGVHTNSIKPSILWDNSVYIFGYAETIDKQYQNKITEWEKKTEEEWKKRFEEVPTISKETWYKEKENELEVLKKQWKIEAESDWKKTTEFKKNMAFIDLCNKIYSDTDAPDFKAVCDFFRKKQIETIWKNDVWKNIRKNPRANITFRIVGNNKIVADNSLLTKYIERDSTKEGVCLVTGKKGRIIRTATPTPIKGCQNSASLISFQKKSGFDSDGKEQCYNSPLSYEADFAIATAIKKLKSPEEHNSFSLGNRLFLFFACTNSEDASLVEEATYNFINFEQEDNPNNKIESVKKTFESIFVGKNKIMSDDKFTIIGIAPAGGREAVVCFLQQSLNDFTKNIDKHFYDMEIIDSREEKRPYYGLKEMLSAVTLGGKQSEATSNLPEALIKSIFQGLPYPYTLFSSCIRRLRAESSESKGIRITRIAIIKAYLNRLNDNNKKITVMLDKTNTNQGYLCGRLFAVLEGLQYAANKQDSIRSGYMNAASSTPSAVFPTILKLSNSHYSKLATDNKGLAIYFDNQKKDIVGMLQDFPDTLDLNDQGRFFLGYYHQKNYKENNKQ